MKIRFKTSSNNKNQSILKNSNFLNSQNYILGKSEKKKLLSKFFVERYIILKNKIPILKKTKFKNDFTLEKFFSNELKTGGTRLTLKSFFYTLFIIIIPIIPLYYFIGISYFIQFPIPVFFLYLSIVGLFLYINIFSLFLIIIYIIGLIFIIIYLILSFIFLKTSNFIFLKYKPYTKIIPKFNKLNKFSVENKYYLIKKK